MKIIAAIIIIIIIIMKKIISKLDSEGLFEYLIIITSIGSRLIIISVLFFLNVPNPNSLYISYLSNKSILKICFSLSRLLKKYNYCYYISFAQM